MNASTLTLTNNLYIAPNGELMDNHPKPQPKILSQANRLRGDIRSAITLIQVCTGLDEEAQKEIQLHTMISWFRWYYRVDEHTDFYCDVESLVYDRQILQLWMAEWNKRELTIIEEYSKWYQVQFKILSKSKYWEPHEKRKLIAIQGAEKWEAMHRDILFNPTSISFTNIVNGLNSLLA